MKVVFACAGTGGHINPAIAIANIILKKEPDSEMLFIGASQGLENELVSKAGFNIKHIRTGKILRSLTLKNIKAVYNTYMGIGDAKKILKEFNPDLVIGTGGYICGPVMLAAKKYKIPYILHESNAFPGMSVKMLAKKASKIMIGFEDAKTRLKTTDNVVFTGTPAKFTAMDIDNLNKEKCKVELELDKIDKKIVLVTCGSQGAKKINNTVIEMIKSNLSDEFYIILVTGENNYSEVLGVMDRLQKELKVNLDSYIKIVKFVYDMDKIYKVADMCVTRAGAMTVTELSIAAKPSILIPLPYATENHQLYNAKVLENVNAAKIIEEVNLTPETLYSNINEIISDDKLVQMSKNARSIVNNNVETNIYNCILDVFKK